MLVVTLAGTAQYPWVLRQSRYCGYCKWVLQGTVGTAGTVQHPQNPWVLQGTAGTVGTAGYWVLWVLQVCTAGYCRVLQGVQKVRAQSAVRNTYRN